MCWMRSEGSTTNIADAEDKIECTPEVPTPPRPKCSGKGWWTMLGLGGADPNAEVDADGGVDVDAASCVLIVMTLWSIKSCTAPRSMMQLFVECRTTQ